MNGKTCFNKEVWCNTKAKSHDVKKTYTKFPAGTTRFGWTSSRLVYGVCVLVMHRWNCVSAV